ncbi:MAG: serine--tRNA ligase, partial [Rhizobiaceae bacterium]|nr:serine--tRNA ligase [Rhizobiaceae bacterium]
MLDIKWIRENPEALAEALTKRGSDKEAARSTVADIVARDEARRTHLTDLQQKQERRNAASKEIGKAMGSGDKDLAEKLKAEVASLKSDLQDGEAKERELDKALKDALDVLPNVPLDDVPVGADEHGNVEVRRHGEPKRSNSSKEHYEIGEALGGMDFETAAKLSG